MHGKLQYSLGWGTRQFLVVCDLAVMYLSFYLSHAVLPVYRPYLIGGKTLLEPFGDVLWVLVLLMPTWYALTDMFGLYSARRQNWGFVFWRLMRVQAVGLVVLFTGFFLLKLFSSRLLVAAFVVLYVPLVMAARWVLLKALEAHRSHVYNITRILVIGSRERAKDFIRSLQRSEEAYYEVVGCVDPDPEALGNDVEGVAVIGTTSTLREYLFHNPVDVVAIAMPADKVPEVQELVDSVLQLGLRLLIVPEFYIYRIGLQLGTQTTTIESFMGLPLAAITNVPRTTTYLAAKRAMDLVVSACLLVVLAPLFLAIAAAIKLTSKGPILYRWNVLGINKKPFASYKFRTMVVDADRIKQQLMKQNEMAGPVFKMKNDPRITPVGRILRKFSLDELPQLYSVLKGDMSLVGPRPPFPEEASRFEFWQRRKLSVKPGITCLWQVNGRSNIRDFEEWARLDLEYIQNASLWLDFKVLLKTVPAVVRGRGAY
jgi:exopolysaccharide biosynthesis polyprenyl glycosylphosphotransferase